MKKGFVLLLCCVLLCFSACASVPVFEETVPTTLETTAGFAFPENTELCGVDIGGMSPEAARNALAKRAAEYELTLTVNDAQFAVSGEEIGVSFDEEVFRVFCENAKAGLDSYPDGLIQYDAAAMQSVIKEVLESKPVDSAVVFSQEKGAFICSPSSAGMDVDLDAAAAAIEEAVLLLQSDVSVMVEAASIAPSVTENDAKLTQARDDANGYLQAAPEYVFTLDLGETAAESLNQEIIASFIRIGKDFSVTVDEEAIQAFAARLAERYGSEAYTGDFRTTGGGTVPFSVDYEGRCVDEAALAADILLCMAEGIDGIRDVPYRVFSDVVELPFGGNYIEIDLTAQKLWVYKDGLCVVESPIVSGCVADGRFTPNGVYEIYEQEEDCWLTGPTWNDYVEYWLAFYQSFGLHDASWRSEFGGDIYLYEGSHGCPNLPPELADDVYNNVSLGTKVILYGGETSVEQLIQEISGTTAYNLKLGDEPFALEAKLKYPGAKLRYRSSNPQVASVAPDGTVTVEGLGSAVITVVAEGFTFHSGASMTVQIQVTP